MRYDSIRDTVRCDAICDADDACVHVRGEIAGGRVLNYECSANREREKGKLRRSEESIDERMRRMRSFCCSAERDETRRNVYGRFAVWNKCYPMRRLGAVASAVWAD